MKKKINKRRKYKIKPHIYNRNQRILSFLRKGNTMKEASKVFGISDERVRQITIQLKYVSHSKKEKERIFPKLLKLYKSGMSVIDIKKKYPKIVSKFVSYLKKNNAYITMSEIVRKRDNVIIKMFKKGYTNEQISEKTNIKKNTVGLRIRHLGFYRRVVGKESEKRTKEIIKLYKQGIIICKIAKIFDVHEQQVRDILKLKGVWRPKYKKKG